MHIVHITAEMAPIAKVGGLGDVILGLSRELNKQGHLAEVILPKYHSLHYGQIEGMQVVVQDLWCYGNGAWQHNTVWAGWVHGIKVYLIEPHSPPYYFDREKIYGYPDDIERFLYFSKAALEFLQRTQHRVDILHLHEWTAAAAAPLYRETEGDAKVVMTLHNLQHQGRCQPQELAKVGLEVEPDPKDGRVNLLKLGILCADWVTTVSPTYLEEIQTPEYAFGLDGVLRSVRERCSGILNGLDHHAWGPGIDPHLPAPFGPEETTNKAKSKALLQARLGLAAGDLPLFGCVARLVPQKGVHLIKHAMMKVLEGGGQFVLLGSAPDPEINRDFHALKIHFSSHPDVHLELHHHEELTRLIYAGSDMFIVPSLFEPCGLTQLIAMRYGSVPIVRRTGGLADTVFDVATSKQPNGFTFEEPTFDAFEEAIKRAIKLWRQDKKRWAEVMANGMSGATSWESPCGEYVEVYRGLVTKFEQGAAATGSQG